MFQTVFVIHFMVYLGGLQLVNFSNYGNATYSFVHFLTINDTIHHFCTMNTIILTCSRKTQ